MKNRLSLLRIHQWAKNSLLFVPMIMAHHIDLVTLSQTVLGFFAFCSLASATYILNDFVGRKEDSLHPTKKNRPLAAQTISLGEAGAWAIACGIIWLSLGFTVSNQFIAMTSLYAVMSVSYTLYIRKVVLLDAIFLAGMYSIRIFIGGAAADVPISKWLLVFSLFFFFSLALLKRYIEQSKYQKMTSSTRGYQAGDFRIIESLGTGTGIVACMIVGFYVSSPDVAALYRHASYLWLLLPILLYWISRLWILGNRQAIDDDPIVFAINDKVSYAVVLLIGLVLCLAL